MDWKEFFKPNKYKINTSLILLVLLMVIGFLKSFFVEFGCHSWDCYNIWLKIFTIFGDIFALPSFLFQLILPNLEINFIIWVILLIFQVGYLYLLSCFIIQLIKK